jgi:hypothetical protein
MKATISQSLLHQSPHGALQLDPIAVQMAHEVNRHRRDNQSRGTHGQKEPTALLVKAASKEGTTNAASPTFVETLLLHNLQNIMWFYSTEAPKVA